LSLNISNKLSTNDKKLSLEQYLRFLADEGGKIGVPNRMFDDSSKPSPLYTSICR